MVRVVEWEERYVFCPYSSNGLRRENVHENGAVTATVREYSSRKTALRYIKRKMKKLENKFVGKYTVYPEIVMTGRKIQTVRLVAVRGKPGFFPDEKIVIHFALIEA